MLKVWGRANALNVRKVIWAMHELDIPYERIDAGRGHGVTDTASYGEMNPNRRVPTIDDDGFVLWESNAIVRYLCARHSPGCLYPEDLRQRFDAERWMDWAAIDLLKAYRTAFNIYTGNNPQAGTQADAADSFAKTNLLLGILDQRLAQGPYVLGDRFTMGDIPPALIFDDWMHLDREVPGLENVKGWYARLRERPATRPAFWGNGTISIL